MPAGASDHHRHLGILGQAIGDPGLVQGGQLRMTGGSEHGGRGPQGLPGGPAEQPGRHPRAGRQDGQQAGVSTGGDADVDGVGPADRDTAEGAEMTWYCE